MKRFPHACILWKHKPPSFLYNEKWTKYTKENQSLMKKKKKRPKFARLNTTMSKITFIDLKFLKLVIILKQINLRIFIRYLGLLLHSSIWQLLQSPPYYNLSASKSKTHFNPKTLDRIHHFSQNPNPKTQKHIHIGRGLRFREREVCFRFRVLQTYWFRWPRSYGIRKLKTKVTRGYAVDPMDDKHADGWKGGCPRARNNKLIWKHFSKNSF